MTYKSVVVAAIRVGGLLGLCAASVIAMSGCDGGSNGSADTILQDPMLLNGHDNAVRAIAATILTASFAGLDGPWERPIGADGSGAKDCPGGGSVTYDEPGRSTEFSSCDLDTRPEVDVILDGIIDERCASRAAGRECVRAGGADGEPLYLSLRDEDEQVSAAVFLQVVRKMLDAETFDDVVNGEVAMFRDAPTSGYGDFELSDLRIVQSFNEEDQRTTAQIDGRYRLSSYDNFNCTSGGVSIETPEPIVYDGAVVGGQFRLDNGAGDSITARFSEDGTISIVGTDGSPDSATYAEIDALCDELSITQTSENPPTPSPEPCTLTIAGVCVI